MTVSGLSAVSGLLSAGVALSDVASTGAAYAVEGAPMGDE